MIEAAAIDGAGRRGPSGRSSCRCCRRRFLPARRQRRLRVLRDLRDHRRGDLRRPGQLDRDPRLQGVSTDGLGVDIGGSAAQSVILMLMVIALTSIQFRYIERKVSLQMVERRGGSQRLHLRRPRPGRPARLLPGLAMLVASTQTADDDPTVPMSLAARAASHRDTTRRYRHPAGNTASRSAECCSNSLVRPR